MTADTYTAARLALMAQEQQSQIDRIAELQRLLSRTIQRVEALEQRVATMEAAWMASMEGAE